MIQLKIGDAITTKYEVLDNAAAYIEQSMPIPQVRSMMEDMLSMIVLESVDYVRGYLDKKLEAKR